MQARYSKLIVKDATGNLIQLLPEIKVDDELDGVSNLPVANSVLYEKFQSLENSIPEIEAYQGATTTEDGIAGLVPAATSAQKENFLKGDGTWTEISAATTAQIDAIFQPLAEAD